MEVCGLTRSFLRAFREGAGFAFKNTPPKLRCFKHGSTCRMSKHCGRSISAFHTCVLGIQPQQLRLGLSRHLHGQQCHSKDSSQTTLGSVIPVFSVVKYESTGNISFFERKKTELYQELGLQARDLRFQHLTSINIRNNCIILRMEILKAVITPKYLLILDYHQSNLEHWLWKDLASQLAGDGQLATYSLPFEFRAIEAILQHRISALQARLNELQPQILETLEALVNPKQMSIDRSKLHILLQDSKNDQSNIGIDLTEEMELLLENYYRQAEDLANTARELKVLIDDSESIIFINLDSHRNVMMRLNLQLTMGTFSVSLFGILGVAFGMNLESSFEEDPRFFWLITGIMFLGSGLMWRRLLSFLGQHLEPPAPPSVPSILKRSQLMGGRVDLRHGSKL
ncbi:magnesium transporter MRS2 homolog, mitochondrial isoform X2 [Pristis pectinata]|uniref:magnesium transporter MRS2 homolog, mitochondrial isoform X2 n=1 Tax=Pristis pectinata TaxID=685728 RepID=UPI00223DF226|nr:magnesium transporter MRS2 homolog, mitochondrial isoform X2 [Pristis pectinata]